MAIKLRKSKAWSVNELAIAASVSKQSVFYAINRGTLPASKVGSIYVIDDDDAQAYIDARRPSAGDER